MKKRGIAIILAAMMILSMTACGQSDGGEKEEGKYTIGICQFAEHGSLDNCREGFIKGLEEEGLVEGENLIIKVKNATADMGTCTQINQSFVSDKVDLICAIATPAAQSAYNASMDKEIPVIYTAITDPVTAELATKDKMPVGKITGTSDILPVEAQLQMIREVLPQAKKIGILYTTSEANSVYTIEQYEKIAGNYGFTIVKKGINTAADISLAAEDLLSKVDCLTNLTDNTVVSSLPTILEMANEKKIPVFGSEIEQVKMGCMAAEGLEYVSLGIKTGKMAAKVLKGEANIEEMAFETVTANELYINEAVFEKLGINIPDTMKERAVESFKEIMEK